MIFRKIQSGPFAERARRSMREIALAVVLTLAALVFLVAALHGHPPETAEISSSPNLDSNRSN